MKSYKKVTYYFLSLFAFMLVCFMHFYKIGQIPRGLYVDEASAAYDAIMLGRFGVDRWLDSFPVYLKNYGDGQNALYVYIMMFFIKIFGANVFAYRIGMCLSAISISVLLFFYIKKSFPNYIYLPAIGVLLYAVTPIFVMSQRYGLESILMMASSMFIPFFFSCAANNNHKPLLYALIYGIACGISLYTYALAYVVVPLFLIFSFAYIVSLQIKSERKITFKRDILHFLCFSIPLVFFALPLLAVQIINYFDLPQKHIGPFTLTKFISYRSADIGIKNIISNVVAIIHNSLIHGELEANNYSQFGPLYFIAIPFVIIGIIVCSKRIVHAFKAGSFSYDTPIMLWLISEFLMGLILTVEPNSTRINGIYIPLFYFELSGLVYVYEGLKNTHWQKVYFYIMTCAYIIFSYAFASKYFKDNQNLKYLFFEPYDEIVEYINVNEEEAWANRGFTYTWNYIYYMLAHKVDPYEYNLPNNPNYTFGKDITNEAEQMGYNFIDKNYILYKTDIQSFDYLESIGYNCFSVGEWFLCISPLDSYVETAGDAATLNLDSITDKNNSITIAGWCFINGSKEIFTEYLVELDNSALVFSPVERNDVVEVFQDNSLLNSGFRLELPLTTFKDYSSIEIYGITKEGSKYLIYSCNK